MSGAAVLPAEVAGRESRELRVGGREDWVSGEGPSWRIRLFLTSRLPVGGRGCCGMGCCGRAVHDSDTDSLLRCGGESGDGGGAILCEREDEKRRYHDLGGACSETGVEGTEALLSSVDGE